MIETKNLAEVDVAEYTDSTNFICEQDGKICRVNDDKFKKQVKKNSSDISELKGDLDKNYILEPVTNFKRYAGKRYFYASATSAPSYTNLADVDYIVFDVEYGEKYIISGDTHITTTSPVCKFFVHTKSYRHNIDYNVGEITIVETGAMYIPYETGAEPIIFKKVNKADMAVSNASLQHLFRPIVPSVPYLNKYVVYEINDFLNIPNLIEFYGTGTRNVVDGILQLSIGGNYNNVVNNFANNCDEWEFSATISVVDANASVGITCYNNISTFDTYAQGAFIANMGENTLNLCDTFAHSNAPSTSSSITIENVTFSVGDIIEIKAIRSGITVIASIWNKTTDKRFTYSTGYRMHSSVSLFTTGGQVDVLSMRYASALHGIHTKILFTGDSITEGLNMGTTDISKRWCSMLRDKYFGGNAKINGYGFAKTNKVLHILNDVESQNLKYQYIAVMIGTNNSTSDELLNTWKTEIIEIYNKIISLGSIPIIIMPPLRANYLDRIYEMHKFILDKGWYTIRMDIATSVDGNGKTFNSSLSTDGIHFNVDGNIAMYERAVQDLNNLFFNCIEL